MISPRMKDSVKRFEPNCNAYGRYDTCISYRDTSTLASLRFDLRVLDRLGPLRCFYLRTLG